VSRVRQPCPPRFEHRLGVPLNARSDSSTCTWQANAAQSATPFPLVNSVSPWQRPPMAELDKRIAAIKRAMRKTKVGNNELARRAGLQKSTVSRVLNGERSPSAKILFALEAVALRAVGMVCEK
jgi:ribosome-binding protein aMBF1 (putative translation factor)